MAKKYTVSKSHTKKDTKEILKLNNMKQRYKNESKTAYEEMFHIMCNQGSAN